MLQTIELPNEDLSLLMQVASEHKWKLHPSKPSKTSPNHQKSVDNFVLTPEQIAILDERAKTPHDQCISEEDFMKYLDEKI